MKKITDVYVDVKVTTWKRYKLDIDQNIEELRNILKTGNIDDVIALNSFRECEYLYENEENLSPEENNYQPTVELLIEYDYKETQLNTIWDNYHNYSEDDENKRKNNS